MTGIIFKPKKPHTLFKRLIPIKDLLDKAISTNRCHFYLSNKSDKNYVSKTFYNGLYLNLFFTVALVIATIYSKFFLQYLGQDKEVLYHTYRYLDIICISLIPLMLFQTFKQFIEGLGHTKPAMYISIFSNVINIILNAILIFGLFGFPRLEIVGAAYATLISRILMFLFIIIYCLKSRRFKSIIFTMNISLNYQSLKSIFGIGFTSGLQYIFEVGAFTVATVIIGSIGAVQLASHQIALNLASISYMIASGIGSASMISLGHFYGIGDKQEIRKYPHPRSYESIENLAKYRGSTVGIKMAEAFSIVRKIEK